MGLVFVANEGKRLRYKAREDGAGAIVDVLCTPDGQVGRLGAGTVHHIAWRTLDDAQLLTWRQDLVALGFNVSPVMDRTYFNSISYREPGGVLFEIATDPPGFALDESPDHLGERLVLPPQYEIRAVGARASITEADTAARTVGAFAMNPEQLARTSRTWEFCFA